MFSFSPKKLTQNLKAKAKTKNMKNLEYHENFSKKKIYSRLSFYFIFVLFIFLFQSKRIFLAEKAQTPT